MGCTLVISICAHWAIFKPKVPHMKGCSSTHRGTHSWGSSDAESACASTAGKTRLRNSRRSTIHWCCSAPWFFRECASSSSRECRARRNGEPDTAECRIRACCAPAGGTAGPSDTGDSRRLRCRRSSQHSTHTKRLSSPQTSEKKEKRLFDR